MTNNFNTLILAYSSECGWCKVYKPHWYAAKNNNNNNNLRFLEYDFDIDNEREKFFKEHPNSPTPKGFPTVIAILDNDKYMLLEGANNPDKVNSGKDVIPTIQQEINNRSKENADININLNGGGLFDWFCGNPNEQKTNKSIEDEDERMYKEKYLKYKNKYLNLKKNLKNN
jgi:thiol-disulfide isomerase/thioredoxin